MSQSVREEIKEIIINYKGSALGRDNSNVEKEDVDEIIDLFTRLLSGLEMETWAHSEIGPLYDAGVSKGIEIMNERISTLKAQLQEETR